MRDLWPATDRVLLRPAEEKRMARQAGELAESEINHAWHVPCRMQPSDSAVVKIRAGGLHPIFPTAG